MEETLSPAERADLGRLWCRRQGLAPPELARVYDMVQRALQGCAPPELHALGESKQELVLQFIYLKVLRLQDEAGDEQAPREQRAGHSAPSTAFALCAYFRRYLIDCTRASAFRRKLSIGTDISA